MTDLIERARAVICRQPQDCYLNAGCLKGCCLVHDLADRIEQLETALKWVRENTDSVAQAICCDKALGDRE